MADKRKMKMEPLCLRGHPSYTEGWGSLEFGMSKRVLIRVLSVALILTVGALAVHAASHFHADACGEQHCQICQVGHVAIPQSAPHVVMQASVPVERFAPAEAPAVVSEPVRDSSVPRAPPA